MGHFDIPKLHALSHYSTWIKEIGTIDNINTALTAALHKTVKAAFCQSNKVDFVPQMCFWDNQRLSVETREATLQYLALNERGL
jgi:hypothetical protein